MLGKTRRQVEYLIKTGRLTARKVGTRWVIDDAELPLSPGQRQARERKASALHGVADEVLQQVAPRTRYSLRDLNAFREALAIFESGRNSLPQDHAALALIRECLDDLAVGCHRFGYRTKADAYSRARDRASLAVCALMVEPHNAAEPLIERLEQTLIPSIAGLLRRTERSTRE